MQNPAVPQRPAAVWIISAVSLAVLGFNIAIAYFLHSVVLPQASSGRLAQFGSTWWITAAVEEALGAISTWTLWRMSSTTVYWWTAILAWSAVFTAFDAVVVGLSGVLFSLAWLLTVASNVPPAMVLAYTLELRAQRLLTGSPARSERLTPPLLVAAVAATSLFLGEGFAAAGISAFLQTHDFVAQKAADYYLGLVSVSGLLLCVAGISLWKGLKAARVLHAIAAGAVGFAWGANYLLILVGVGLSLLLLSGKAARDFLLRQRVDLALLD